MNFTKKIFPLAPIRDRGIIVKYSPPIKLLKCASSIIAPIQSEISNISVTLRKYPSKLKLSKITPIFKSGEDNDANNYRPISLLSNFNRIFEKIMYNRMKDYIDKHKYMLFTGWEVHFLWEKLCPRAQFLPIRTDL